MRSRAALLLFSMLASACAGSPFSGDRRVPPELVSDELIVLGAGTGVAAIDPATGGVARFAGVPTADWSSVVSATQSGGDTVVETVDAASGEVVASAEVEGALEVRTVSADASRVAMMPADAPEPWAPEPRLSTDVVVLSMATGEATSYRLDGNFEPEAFASRGGLFMVSYVPPQAPTAYRVTRLRLSDGEILPVFTGVKRLVETMSGTRLEQVAAADGSYLFTLYTSAPSAADDEHHGVPFVHVLALEDGWAHCIALPERFSGAGAAEQAMAATSRYLYVVNAANGALAVVDAKKLEVVEESTVDVGPWTGGPASAAVAPDGGSLFVSNGAAVTAIDTETLQPVRRWNEPEPVSAVGVSESGDAVYAARPSAVSVREPSTGRALGEITGPALDDVAYVGPPIP